MAKSARAELYLIPLVVALCREGAPPLGLTLKALFDAELCEEATLQYWHAKVAATKDADATAELIEWFTLVN